MSKNSELSFDDFIALLSYRCKLSKRTTEKVYMELLKFVQDELKMCGSVRMHYFGEITTKYNVAQDREIPCRGMGHTVKRYCAPTVSVRMKLFGSFKKPVQEYILGAPEVIEETEKTMSKTQIASILMKRYKKYATELEEEEPKPVEVDEDDMEARAQLPDEDECGDGKEENGDE